MLLRLLVVALVLVSAGCRPPAPRARFDGARFVRGHERFEVDEPEPPWQRVSAPSGDLAWFHPPSRAVMGANATCRGHKDAPLGILVNDLLMGTTHRRLLLEEEIVLDGRAARHEVVSARLDGVTLVYDLYVLKKDGCVYDLTLLTTPSAYDGVADEFVDFVAAFRATGSS